MASAQEADMARQIQQACITLQQAADASARSAADHFLQSFRASARPYSLCMLLLHSEQTDSQAQFVALSTMKEALRREGRLLGLQQLNQCKEQLLQLVQAKANVWSRYVLKQCLHVIAILFKWMCLEADENELQVRKAGGGAASAGATDQGVEVYLSMANCVATWLQRGMEGMERENAGAAPSPNGAPLSSATYFSLALELCNGLIHEFSPGGQASNAGVSVSMHVRCHTKFEKHVLHNLANLVLNQCLPTLLRTLMTRVATPLPSPTLPPVLLNQLSMLHSLLSFLDTLLHFDFGDEKRPDALSMRWAMSTSGNTAEVDAPTSFAIKPSSKWSALLVQSELMEMIVAGYNVLHGIQQQVPGMERQFAQGEESFHLMRDCLLQLASLRGEVLTTPPATAAGSPPPPSQPRTSIAFFERLCGALNALLEGSLRRVQAQQQSAPGGGATISDQVGSELLGLSSIVSRLLTNANIESLLQFQQLPLLLQLVQLQHDLALLLLPLTTGSSGRCVRGLSKHVSTSTYLTECMDVVLESWYTLIHQLDEMRVDHMMQGHQGTPLGSPLDQVTSLVQQRCGAVFERYVVERVQALEAEGVQQQAHNAGDEEDEEDEEDEDEGQFTESSYIDEHMQRVAALGKVHIGPALQVVSGKIMESLHKWKAAVEASQQPNGASGSTSLYSLHELLYFLLRLLGHLLSNCSSWQELDGDQLFANIGQEVLESCMLPPNGGGALPIQLSIESICHLTTFINQLLSVTKAPDASVDAQHKPLLPSANAALKSFCSPLVLECLIWTWQQLVSTGYLLINEHMVSTYTGEMGCLGGDKPFPSALLALYGGGSDPAHQGRDSLHVLSTQLSLVQSLLCCYNEEPTLMDLTCELIGLWVRHPVIRMQLKQQITAPSPSSPQVFRVLFQESLMHFLQVDPYPFVQDASGSMVVRYQVQQPLYALSHAVIQQMSFALVQSMLFKPDEEVPSNAPSHVRAWKRAESLHLLHSTLLPLTSSFFGVLMNPLFVAHASRSFLLHSLTSHVTFMSSLIREVGTDYFEFLWAWITDTDKMASIVPGDKDMDAKVTAILQEARGRKAPAAGMSILSAMVQLVQQYGSEQALSNAVGYDASPILDLLSLILHFFTHCCDSFLAYLDEGQSYLFMQATLTLVKAFTAFMERRTSKAVLAVRAAEQAAARTNNNSNHAQSLKHAALASDLSLLEESEWDILHSLLCLLEGLSSKDLLDLSTDSVEFASDAVLSGLLLLTPHLTHHVLSHPTVSELYFTLLRGLVSSNPDKIAAMAGEGERNKLFEMISKVMRPAGGGMGTSGAESPSSTASTHGSPSPSPPAAAAANLSATTSTRLHNTLLKEACASVQSLSQYHLYFISGRAEQDRIEAEQEAQRRVATGKKPMVVQPPPPPSPFAPACASFLECLLQLLLFQSVSHDVLEAVSDALLPTILCQPSYFMGLVQRILSQWKQQQASKVQASVQGEDQQRQLAELERMSSELEAGFQKLIPSEHAQSGVKGGSSRSSVSMRSMQLERSQRMVFRQQVRAFVLTARPLLAVQ